MNIFSSIIISFVMFSAALVVVTGAKTPERIAACVVGGVMMCFAVAVVVDAVTDK